MFKSESKQRYYFTPDQLELIMANAGRFHDFYYLLLHTGIRCTDAYKLNPEHFDGKYIQSADEQNRGLSPRTYT